MSGRGRVSGAPANGPPRPRERHANGPRHSAAHAHEGTVRCFVAVPVPETVRALCARAVDALRDALPAARWVTPENMHLTLKFLGAVPRERIAGLQDALLESVAVHPSFAVCTDELGVFGRWHRPRVLWLGVAGNLAALGALHATVERVCCAAEVVADTRPYHPHLTLGRLRVGAEGLREEWARNAVRVPATSWDVGEVRLYESRLRPEGAEHRTIAICSLGDGSSTSCQPMES